MPPLREAILAYLEAHTERGTPCRWVKTADILDTMRRSRIRT
jgi:hypothetical protein